MLRAHDASLTRSSGHDHPLVQNIMDGFFLAEFVLRHLIQQEASGNPVSDEGPGAEAINSYNVSSSMRWHFFPWPCSQADETSPGSTSAERSP